MKRYELMDKEDIIKTLTEVDMNGDCSKCCLAESDGAEIHCKEMADTCKKAALQYLYAEVS